MTTKSKSRRANQTPIKVMTRIFKYLKATAEWVQKNPIPSLAALIALLLASGAISWQEVQTALLKLK
jgi:hypothetical protein